MNVGRAMLLMAQFVISANLALARLYGPYWLLLAAFMGPSLVQASVTGFRQLDSWRSSVRALA